MTIQMTRFQHNSARSATGGDALLLPWEETPLPPAHSPQRDAIMAYLGHLAARVGRLEGVQAGQQAAHRGDVVSLQVTISPLVPPAPQSTTRTGPTTVRVRGPEVTAAGNRRDRVRWPRYRAG